MKRTVFCAMIFLAAGAAAATAAGEHSASPSASRCGGSTWRLKTFSDAQRKQVDLVPDATTIRDIRARRGPGRALTRRATPFQLHVWELPAQITKYRLDPNGSLRLELYDNESYMNAVIPSLNCLSGKTRDRADIQAAWRLFVLKCGKPTLDWKSFGGILFVRGIGYWSQKQPLRGTAPNGAELHPVTGLRIVAGC
jgi:hypothetical protein